MNIAIIGASGGLGSSILKSTIDIAKNIIVTSTRKKKLNFLKKNKKIKKYTLDFNKERDIKNFLKKIIRKYKHIDVIIITVGFFAYDNNVINYSKLLKFFSINVFGYAVLINEFYNLKKNKKKTNIFSVGSSSALKNFPSTSLYCSSKHAMDSIIKCLNFKTKKKNIFNTLVHTGSIKTKMGKKIKFQNYEDFLDPKKISKKILYHVKNNIYKETIKILRKNV